MGIAHVTATFEHKSGLIKDRVVNTFTFRTPGDFIDPVDAGNIRAALEDFYNTAHGTAGRSLGSWLSTSLSRTVKPIYRFYDITADLAGTPAGSPLFTLNALANLANNVSGEGLPAEVAYALSFRGDFGADVEFAAGSRPRARDRGRIYFGPLGLDAVVTGGPGVKANPSAGLKDSVLQAGAFLRDEATTEWVVWSRAGAKVTPVTVVSIDDAFDTQRRRGEAPTAKTAA